MTAQLDMFSPISATASSTDFVGLPVKLEHPADPGHHRCSPFVTVGSSKGIHHNALICNSCGKNRGWLGVNAIEFINETRARFGAPEIIILRTPRGPQAQVARRTTPQRPE